MENFDQMKEISTGGEYVLIHQGVGSDITDSDQIVIKTEVSVDDWNGFDPITSAEITEFPDLKKYQCDTYSSTFPDKLVTSVFTTTFSSSAFDSSTASSAVQNTTPVVSTYVVKQEPRGDDSEQNISPNENVIIPSASSASRIKTEKPNNVDQSYPLVRVSVADISKLNIGQCFNIKKDEIKYNMFKEAEMKALLTENLNFYEKDQKTLFGTVRKRFKCFHCSKVYLEKRSIVYHLRTLLNHRPFKCETCDKSFVCKDSLEAHKIKHGGYQYHCKKCNKIIYNKKSIRDHLKLHAGNRPYSCSKCDKCFTKRMVLKNHELRHNEEKNFRCKECDRLFVCVQDLKKHELNVHSSPKRMYGCEVCGKHYKYTTHLKRHMATHGEKLFQCSICGKAFFTYQEVKQHKKWHTNTLSYVCDEKGCGKKFKVKEALSKHKHSHNTEPCICPICSKSCKNAITLSVHVKIHRKQRQRFPCSECGTKLLSKASLKKHLRIHSKSKMLACPFCDRTFANADYLQCHMKCHTEEKKFQCDQCGYSCHRPGDLRRHLRVHTGDQPFKCGVCDRAFNCQGNLARHKRYKQHYLPTEKKKGKPKKA